MTMQSRFNQSKRFISACTARSSNDHVPANLPQPAVRRLPGGDRCLPHEVQAQDPDHPGLY